MGELKPKGKEDINGTYILGKYESEGANIPTIWTEKDFYTTKGTEHIQNIFQAKDFQYPKPVALIAEVLRTCTSENSLVLDFFAGSGTTLNAINLLNEQDGLNRRCIMVTNNELSKNQIKQLKKMGVSINSDQWEKYGVCRSITWPRTVCTIKGINVHGDALDGNYSEDLSMADGFMSNVAYFKLGFLDKTAIALGKQLKELIPLLWLKAGAIGKCPSMEMEHIPDYNIFIENRMAILIKEAAFTNFLRDIENHPTVETIYIVTDYEAGYRTMANCLNGKKTYQLYRDYLDNFRINQRR